MSTTTAAQRRVLDVIRAHIAEHGFPPTLREIADAIGITSTNGVRGHLARLARAGKIALGDGKRRAIRVLS